MRKASSASKTCSTGVGLHRQRLELHDVALLAQGPVGDRPDARRAARDEAADGGDILRRGEHRHFPALGDEGGVDVGHQRACLHPHEALADLEDAVHRRRLEDQPAPERHRLPVVPGAAAADRDRDVMGVGGGKAMGQFLPRFRARDQIAEGPAQLGVQDRGIPEEIAAAFLDRDRVVETSTGASSAAMRDQSVSGGGGVFRHGELP
jgi:hypothetical protein